MPSFIFGAISKLPFLNAGTFMGCNLISLLLSVSGKVRWRPPGSPACADFPAVPPPSVLNVCGTTQPRVCDREARMLFASVFKRSCASDIA